MSARRCVAGPSCIHCFGASGAGVAGALGICMPGMWCMSPVPGVVCPGWGCIIAMLRQQGHPPAACWTGWVAPCVDCPGCDCAWAVVMGRPHVIPLAAVAPVWADAWVIIGQARAGVP
jgi:hypothetical protein